MKLPILIRGDSGTGKDVVANAIHQASTRKDKAFISVNMAAIPRELAGSELFGSVKGGFTGASSRKGCFQQADNGTLFLDEIGEAPIEVQVALLRALETGVVQPIGSEKSAFKCTYCGCRSGTTYWRRVFQIAFVTTAFRYGY